MASSDSMHTRHSGLCAAIELAVNRALTYDPASKQKASAISDILALDINTPNITLYLRGHSDGIAVMSHCEAPIATHLQGSIIDLLSLIKQPTSLANSPVNLVGSSQLLQQWQNLLQNLDIDWEDAISEVLGDIAGPIASSGIRKTTHWASTQYQEQQRMFSEALSEEWQLIPSKAEAEHLFSQINQLTQDTERLNAKVNKLRERFSPSENEST